MNTAATAKIEARNAIERAWAAHLDTCMDPACATCADFDAALYNA